jgi:hypothetical protein
MQACRKLTAAHPIGVVQMLTTGRRREGVTIFCQDVLEYLLVHRQLCYQPLQPRILPTSACFSTATICSTESRFLFTANLPSSRR